MTIGVLLYHDLGPDAAVSAAADDGGGDAAAARRDAALGSFVALVWASGVGGGRGGPTSERMSGWRHHWLVGPSLLGSPESL